MKAVVLLFGLLSVFWLLKNYGVFLLVILIVWLFFKKSQRKNNSVKAAPSKEPTIDNPPIQKGNPEIDRAQKLAKMAKSHAIEWSSAVDVFEFTYEYKKVIDILNDLIVLNEDHGIPMTPAPRSELHRIKSEMSQTIDDFICNAVGNIYEDGEDWADAVDSLMDEIENDDVMSRLLTSKNKNRILQMRKEAAATKEREKIYEDVRSVQIQEKQQPEPAKIDYERILTEEATWRREQMGQSSVEYELERIDKMDGHTFEHWCAKLLSASGFNDVEVTRGSGDQGVDVLATLDGVRYAVQCKCYSSDLGNKPVQEVYAGIAIYKCQLGSVMTNRYFTAGAKELAEATRISLWDRDWIISLLNELDESAFPL